MTLTTWRHLNLTAALLFLRERATNRRRAQEAVLQTGSDDECVCKLIFYYSLYTFRKKRKGRKDICYRVTQIDRRKERKTDRQADRERENSSQIHRKTDRQTDMQRDRQVGRNKDWQVDR